MRYVVNGLPENEAKKTSLCESTPVDELKVKLRKLTLTNSLEQPSASKGSNKPHKKTFDKPKTVKCFKCGGEGHRSVECSEKPKVRKCYNCDMQGHIAKDCRQPKATTSKGGDTTATVSIIEAVTEGNMMIPIEIKGMSTNALLDTGSPYTLMDKATYDGAKLGPLDSYTVPLKGFAGQEKRSLGSIKVKVYLQNNNFTR